MKTLRHYIGLLVFAALILGGGSIEASDEWHDFSDIEGRTVRGRMKDFNTQAEIVTMEREDGKTFQSPLSKFCKADQHYIREWRAERDFNDLLFISAVLKTYDKPPVDMDMIYRPGNVRYQGYVVKLDNRSQTTFSKVEIEYCLYYHEVGNMLIHSEGVQCGQFEIEEFAPHSKHEFMTETVLVYNNANPITPLTNSRSTRCEIIGIWLRIHATLPSGERPRREVCLPPDLSHGRVWKILSEPLESNGLPRH